MTLLHNHPANVATTSCPECLKGGSVDELKQAAFHLQRGLDHLRLAQNEEAETWRGKLVVLEAEAESVAERTGQLVKELALNAQDES